MKFIVLFVIANSLYQNRDKIVHVLRQKHQLQIKSHTVNSGQVVLIFFSQVWAMLSVLEPSGVFHTFVIEMVEV